MTALEHQAMRRRLSPLELVLRMGVARWPVLCRESVPVEGLTLFRGECTERPDLVRFACRARASDRHKNSNSFCSFVLPFANFATLCALALVGWGTEISRAQVSDAEKAAYADALAYCRGDIARPMVLRTDKRVLCLDGQIFPGQDVSSAKGLEEDGLFVVRSPGGDIPTAAALADLLRDRRATVVVCDYCLSACASYLPMASTKTFVLRDTLVAWHYTADPFWCPSLVTPKDDGPKRLEKSPCPDAPLEIQDGDKSRRYLNYKFYRGRTVDPLFDDPPESFTIRKILRSMFEGTGRYPDVLWTWSPRHYASMLKTKIVYEAYPNSQAEVDAMASKLALPPSSTIHSASSC
jgi:hypothetical protein